MSTFAEFVKHLTHEDIDLDNKLDNMSGSEISEELYTYISENEQIKERIVEYIKNNIEEYETYIVDETQKLADTIDTCEAFDYSNGLYNCDALYMEAIMDAIGILFNPYH